MFLSTIAQCNTAQKRGHFVRFFAVLLARRNDRIKVTEAH
jgi:hypothetical protein